MKQDDRGANDLPSDVCKCTVYSNSSGHVHLRDKN